MIWKNLNWVNEEVQLQLKRLSTKKAKLDSLRPIPAIAVKNIKESLDLEWTYNSNAIEGNTLSIRETQMVIEEGVTIKGKSLREHFEVVNHQEAIEFIEKLAQKNVPLTARNILDVHELVLQKIEKDFAGRFRDGGVRITGANFAPPNAHKVPDMVDELVEWLDEVAAEHPVLVNTHFHYRLVWIHPFFDGNGRTARLICNLLLLKKGYPPAIILKNDRKKYYDALNKANQGDYSKLWLVVAQSVERTLDIYLSCLNDNYHDYQPIQNIANEPDVPYSQEYISLLARKGKIDAFKEGRNWLTTKAAVQEYIANRLRERKLN